MSLANNIKYHQTFILGSGFSKNAGLPVQAEISETLLSRIVNNDLERAIIIILREFLDNVFDYKSHQRLPNLEDIFTCIDLSANSGYPLGKYDPGKLRAIRRMAIHRILTVLDRKYAESSIICDLLRKQFANDYQIAFIVMNWDVVLENHLASINQKNIDYCCETNNLEDSEQQSSQRIPICKMHGSSNWIYCDSCKSLFFSNKGKLALNTNAFLEKKDFDIFNNLLKNKDLDISILKEEITKEKCKYCHNELSSQIATFSFKKSFRTHIYPSIWHEAEKILAHSDQWSFIGYSLPEADYEFKHLLKSSQLRSNPELSIRDQKKWIDIVYQGSNETKERFERFFGPDIIQFYKGGIENYIV